MSTSPVVRCAIYTRKSTEEGLEQSFNTLQAQRESAEAYILSHKQEGWHAVPTVYNDGGFSGASLERPGLQQLLSDIEARRIDCVVVYKVDRLSRSLLLHPNLSFANHVYGLDALNGSPRGVKRPESLHHSYPTLIARWSCSTTLLDSERAGSGTVGRVLESA
jgi:hypothetical protein